MNSADKRILWVWLLLVVLSLLSYRLIDGGGSVWLLFAVVFFKLERIWSVYLEVDRGPRWLRGGVIATTGLLTGLLAIIVR